MLPDFIELKRQLIGRAMSSLDAGASPIVSLASRIRLHEGKRLVVVRDDGKVISVELEAHHYEAQLHQDKLIQDGLVATAEVLRQLQDQMAQDLSRRMITDISAACDEIGNTIGGRGQLTAEMILEGFEKMELQFDEAGNWITPTFAIHPLAKEILEAQLLRLESEPQLRARLAELLDRRKDAWRDREAHRTLVD
jgi:hypothetical protein